MIIDLNQTQRCRSEIADIAQAMLDARCSYIEGSRMILHRLDGARISNMQEPFRTFAAIDSETDAVPIGAQRELWTDAAAAHLRPNWDAAETWARKHGEAACRATILWLNANPVQFRLQLINMQSNLLD